MKILKQILISGLLLLTGALVIYAANINIFNSGDILTTSRINELVDKINDLETNSGGTPSGAVMAFGLSSCPTGWSPADGQDGRLDLRGQFLRGLNDFGTGARVDGNEDPDGGGRSVGSHQGDAIRNITGSLQSSSVIGPVRWDGSSSVGTVTGAFGVGASTAHHPQDAGTPGRVLTFDASNVVPTADENRPKNIALLYCVKN